MPTWFVIGILINLSNKFSEAIYGGKGIESGRAIMYSYVAISLGDIAVGFISKAIKSRKKVLLYCYTLTVLMGLCYFNSSINYNNNTMYFYCAMLGLSTGYWAIFVTIGAEQFGTNLRATAATTIPNMVRGSLPLMNLLFKDCLMQNFGVSLINSAIITGCIVMAISFYAAIKIPETYHKDLDYVEM